MRHVPVACGYQGAILFMKVNGRTVLLCDDNVDEIVMIVDSDNLGDVVTVLAS